MTNLTGRFACAGPIDRLVTAVIVEQHDEWAVAERRYFRDLDGSTAARRTDIARAEPDPTTAGRLSSSFYRGRVPSRLGVADTALATVRRYCDNKIPAQHRDELRVECDVRDKSITIFECRPPWHPDLGPDWTRQPVAQLRYNPAGHHWRLYCADRNSCWHYYDMSEPTAQLNELLTEIDEDPTGIFWG